MIDAAERGLTVFVVDDDPSVRDALALLFSVKGYPCATYASAEDFLAAFRSDRRGCLVTDLRLPGMSGLDLQNELRARGVELPVVIITGHGDINTARMAFKADAVDFIEKPFDERGPLEAVEVALRVEASRVDAARAERKGREAWLSLTERERTIAGLVVQGLHNREIAVALAISPRTVEVHKARVMEKVGARSLSELIRLAKGGGGA